MRVYTVLIDKVFRKMWAVPSSVIFCSISMLMFPGTCLVHFSQVLRINPKFPMIIGITVVFIPHILFISISNDRCYLWVSIYWKRVEINEQKIKKLICKLKFQIRIHLIYWIFIDEA